MLVAEMIIFHTVLPIVATVNWFICQNGYRRNEERKRFLHMGTFKNNF